MKYLVTILVLLICCLHIKLLCQKMPRYKINGQSVFFTTNEPNFFETSNHFTKTLVCAYKDMFLYSIVIEILRTNNDIPLPSIKRQLYFVTKKGFDSLYYIKDTLSILHIWKRFPKDPVLTYNTLMHDTKNNYLDTSIYLPVSIKKNARKIILTVQDTAARLLSVKNNYTRIWLSKSRNVLKHQIVPTLDKYFGMRTYKITELYTDENNGFKEKTKFITKTEKVSPKKKAEIIAFLNECEEKLFK